MADAITDANQDALFAEAVELLQLTKAGLLQGCCPPMPGENFYGRLSALIDQLEGK